MLHRYFYTLSVAAVLMGLFMSCDRGADNARPDQSQPSKPGNGNRPSDPAVSNDFERETTDPTTRFTGPSITLRYDSPGVLVMSRGRGDREFVNLDGSERVRVRYAVPRSDSIVPSPSLLIGNETVPVAQMKMRHRSGDVEWYIVTTATGHEYLLVAD